jgi:hypothetical protein
MTTPKSRPPDDLEERLATSFERATQRAEVDLADGRLAGASIDRGRRSARRAPILRGGLVVATVAVLGLATLWSAGSHPRPSPAPSIAALDETPHASYPPTDANGSEITQAAPSDEGILYLDSFPPTVDGAPVYAVGPDANAAIAAARDNSPILISGWFVGAMPRGCVQDFDFGSPTPNGIFFKDCAGTPLAATPGGPEALRVYVRDPFRDVNVFPVRASVAEVQRILLRVHVLDPGCGASDCQRKPVVDATVMLGQPGLSPNVVAQTMPPKMIPITTAIGIARPLAAEMLATGDLVVVRVQAGPTMLFADQLPPGQYSAWVYVITFDTPDGRSYATIGLDASTGAPLEQRGGTGSDGLNYP